MWPNMPAVFALPSLAPLKAEYFAGQRQKLRLELTFPLMPYLV